MPSSATPKSLSAIFQQYVTLPFLVICLAMSIATYWVFIEETNRYNRRGVSITINWVAESFGDIYRSGDESAIAENLQRFTHYPRVNGVYLFNSDEELLTHYGEVWRSTSEFAKDREIGVQTLGDLTIFSVPIFADPDTDREISAWLVVTVDMAHAILSRYRSLVVLLITYIIGCGLLLYFQRRVQSSIESPLSDLQTTIERLDHGHIEARAAERGSIEMQHLSRSINRLGNNMESQQEELQKQIDQATGDIQQTLETIEIQNIELSIARKEAIEANQVKSEFLANTSHEIKTPINGIIGFASLLKKTALSKQQSEYLDTIENSALSLLTIINDILDFSRLESGQLSLDTSPINLREITEEIVRILAPAAAQKELQLIFLLAPDTPLTFYGDALRIRQIINNIIDNAIKFSSNSNIIIRADQIEKVDNLATIRFSISDFGVGISEEKQELILSAFTQADMSSKRSKKGTGLGLAIAKGLAEKMGGHIDIDSELNRGTTLSFTLKLRERVEDQNKKYKALSSARIGVFSGNPMLRVQVNQYIDQWGAKSVNLDNIESVLSQLNHCKQSGQELDLICLIANGYESELDTKLLLRISEIAKSEFDCPILLSANPNSTLAKSPLFQATDISLLFNPFTFNSAYEIFRSLIRPRNSNDASPEFEINGRYNSSVLVVDDNEANRLLLSELLRGFCTNVHNVDCGKEAINQAKKQKFDLIFMDIQMPDMDGLEATRRIRALEHSQESVRTPIIALTAHALAEQKSEILLAGMDDYATKPITESKILTFLQRWIPDITNKAPVNQLISNQIVDQKPTQKVKIEEISSTVIMDRTESLRLTGQKPELAKDMLKLLEKSIQEELPQIRDNLKENNWITLLEEVHKLHGGCSYCGVPQLKSALYDLETALKKTQYSSADALGNIAIDSMEALLQWIEDHDLDVIFAD